MDPGQTADLLQFLQAALEEIESQQGGEEDVEARAQLEVLRTALNAPIQAQSASDLQVAEQIDRTEIQLGELQQQLSEMDADTAQLFNAAAPSLLAAAGAAPSDSSVTANGALPNGTASDSSSSDRD